jgi:hypothetical protein
MFRQNWHETTETRLQHSVVSLVLAAVIALVVPAGAASAKGNNGGKDIVSTTENYVETFYPLWFTYTQFKVAPHNQLIGPDKISPLYQGVVAINDDTLYASSPIDVTSNPVTVTVPQTVAGYSVLLLDTFGNIYPSGVPSKAAGVTTPATVYTLIGPDSTRSVSGTTVRLPLNLMILIFRADRFSNGDDQTGEADKFRAALQINGKMTKILSVDKFAFPVKTIADTLIRRDPIVFLSETQEAVVSAQTPALTPQEQKLSGDFDALFGDGSNLGPAEQIMFEEGARSAHDALLSNYLGNVDANNWIHFTNIGDWGKNVLDRASITEFIQFGNGISTAAYYHAFLDANGAPLEASDPGGYYVMTFPAGGAPEASRFWSLTAYTPKAIEMIPNDIDKYVVASYTPGLEPNPDGSISIYISQEQPDGVPEANWLPVSDRAFNLMLRVYGVVPKSDVAKNKYVPPPVEYVPPPADQL